MILLTKVRLWDNIAAYNRYRILPRCLRNVRDIDTSTSLFGHKVRIFLFRATHSACCPDINSSPEGRLGHFPIGPRSFCDAQVGPCRGRISNFKGRSKYEYWHVPFFLLEHFTGGCWQSRDGKSLYDADVRRQGSKSNQATP